MRIVKSIAIGLIVLVAILAIVGFFLPSQARVERSIQIDAAPSEVYAVISDFGQFNEWSPWFAMDPDARYTMTGTPATIGSRFAWKSDKPEVGSGSQTITGLEPQRKVRVELDFADQGKADSYYELTPADGGTRVVWGFTADMGGNPFMHYFALLMDPLLGPDYELGLAQLKTYIEGGAETP